VRGTVPELETRLVTIQQELLSRGRLMALIARLNLYPTGRARATQDSLVQTMRRNIRVELSGTDRGRQTTIGLKISYIGLDPRTAAAVPNELASQYIEENTRIRERHSGQMAGFLKGQLARAAAELDRQQTRVNQFKEQRAGQLPEQLSMNMVTVERLNTQLRLNADAQSRVRERADRIAGTVPADDAADPLAALKSRLSELQTKFTDRHPDVIRTKALIAEMEQQRAATARGTRAPSVRAVSPETTSELAALQKEERMLRSEIAAYDLRIQSAPVVEQELDAIESDYKAAKDAYDSLLRRYEEAQLADSLEQTKKVESFRILDAAVIPTFPAAPNRARLLIMACFLATAAGIGIMLLLEHLDTSFHTGRRAAQFTTLPVLATIPVIDGPRTVGTAARVALKAVAVVGLCALLAGFAYRTARNNTQLVWMISAPQL
jgi:polysaccharide chain length determinant protein (PEP-CTERM system associated)